MHKKNVALTMTYLYYLSYYILFENTQAKDTIMRPKILFLITTLLIFQSTNCSFLTGNGNQEDNSALLLFFGAAGVSSSGNLNLEPGQTLDLSGDGTADGTLVDANGDGVSDGIDLTGDGIPNILLIDTNGDSIPDALDINADGQPDYFLNPNAPPVLTTGTGGTGQAVTLILGSGGTVVGFDTDGDGTANDTTIATILSDTTLPTVSISPDGGTFSTGQTVTITCSDNLAPASIIYTINSGAPSYPSTGTLIAKASGAVSLSSDGSYSLRAICRDLGGNVSSPVVLKDFTIDSNVPSISISTQTSQYVSNAGGAIASSTVTWQTNRAGTFTIREAAGDCSSGTIVSGPTAVAAASNQIFVRSAGSHFSGEGTKTYRICVTTASSLVGSTTFSLTRDDTAPSVTPSSGSGNFGTATSVSLTCSDTGGSGCDKIVYNTQTGSAPSDPTINGSTGVVGTGSAYVNVPISMTDGFVTYLKYRARDQAGNVSSVISQNYTVDTQVATVTVNSHSDKVASGSATLGWQSSRNGTYSIRIGGTDCTNGTAATGTNTSGSATASTPISTSINNGNLSEGSNTLRICVANLIGNYGSTSRSIVKDVTVPTISITNPTVSTPIPSNSQLTLSGTDTGGTGIQKYAYTVDGNNPTFSGTDCTIGTGTAYTSSVSLSNGNYTIKARSCDNVGNVSTIASQIVSIGPPGAPSISSAAAGDGKVTINFGAVSGATNYKVYYRTSSGVTTSDSSVSGTSSPIEVTGLTNATTYYFAITASHNGGESALSSVSNATPTPLVTVNETGVAAEIDYCAIQYPTAPFSVILGTITSFYARVYEAGYTDVNTDPHPSIIAQFGYGPSGTDPRTNGSWIFTTATFNAAAVGGGSLNPNDDEYYYALTPADPGSYLYVFRFTRDGTNYTYCDSDGAGSNPSLDFEITNLGSMTVTCDSSCGSL